MVGEYKNVAHDLKKKVIMSSTAKWLRSVAAGFGAFGLGGAAAAQEAPTTKVPIAGPVDIDGERAKLRVVVRNAGYSKQRNTILQQGNNDDIGIVAISYSRELELVLVSDEPMTSKVLDTRKLSALGLSLDQAMALGRRQVLAGLPAIPANTDIDESVITTPNIDYIASLILAEGWDALNVSVGGNLVVAIPSDDVIIITSAVNESARADLRAYVKNAYDNANRSVSASLYIRKNGKWVEDDTF